MRRSTETTEFCVLSKTKNVRVVGSWLKRFCEKRDVGADELEDIIIAMDEAVTNIMMHGYQGRPDGLIEIRCQVHGRLVELRIRDTGTAFATPCIDSLVSKKREEYLIKGGYGLILMHRFMDGVEFCQDGCTGKNVLLMRKHF